MSTWSIICSPLCPSRLRSQTLMVLNVIARSRRVLTVTMLAASSLLGCHSTLPSRTLPYRIDDLAAVQAPDLPPLCEGDLPTGRPWVLFTSGRCASCRELHRALSTAATRIREADITVVEYSIDEDSCRSFTARRSSADFPHQGIAGDDAVRRWAVRSVPMLFFVNENIVHAVLHGAAPSETILAEQQRIDRTRGGRRN